MYPGAQYRAQGLEGIVAERIARGLRPALDVPLWRPERLPLKRSADAVAWMTEGSGGGGLGGWVRGYACRTGCGISHS